MNLSVQVSPWITKGMPGMPVLNNPKLLKEADKRREVIKKVIAYMTLGIDVSRVFSEMVMAASTKDLVVKKMVYHFLCNYAQQKSDLALLNIGDAYAGMALLYRQVQQQATLLAYMDQYRLFTYILLCLLPLVLFLKRPPRQTGKIELDVH